MSENSNYRVDLENTLSQTSTPIDVDSQRSNLTADLFENPRSRDLNNDPMTLTPLRTDDNSQSSNFTSSQESNSISNSGNSEINGINGGLMADHEGVENSENSDISIMDNQNSNSITSEGNENTTHNRFLDRMPDP